MKTSIEPKTGSFILLAGPRSLNATMLEAIARLGAIGPARVLDGGNRFNAYKVARAAYGWQDILNRITVSRAFTCYQVPSLLESNPASEIPFVVPYLLATYYDDSVNAGERKRLLRGCLAQLQRLEGAAGGVASDNPWEIPPGPTRLQRKTDCLPADLLTFAIFPVFYSQKTGKSGH